MFVRSEFRVFCTCPRRTVTLTVCGDAVGGFGCAIACGELEYTCSAQASCPFFGAEDCALRRYASPEEDAL